MTLSEKILAFLDAGQNPAAALYPPALRGQLQGIAREVERLERRVPVAPAGLTSAQAFARVRNAIATRFEAAMEEGHYDEAFKIAEQLHTIEAHDVGHSTPIVTTSVTLVERDRDEADTIEPVPAPMPAGPAGPRVIMPADPWVDHDDGGDDSDFHQKD